MASTSAKSAGEPITVKKYANRRLYNKATSTYVTLDHLAEMVKEGVEFVVYDAKTGEDITRSVLTQIIVEEESKGQHLLPTSFLRHLISFYGDSLQGLVPRYLDYTMHSFAQNQDELRDQFKNTFDGFFPFGNFEEVGKQNMMLFENFMKMFAPFAVQNGEKPEGQPDAGSEDESDLQTLRNKLNRMQAQLDALDAADKDESDK
ncbi:MAG: polyhydroxyalkanoate synthesis repressor PhaR [Magnetospiraceae bacterium]